MYGDSQALLSSDDSNMPIIFPTNPNSNEEHFPLLMESHYSSSSSQNNSGLLRFRSAPTSLLSNFTTTTGAEKTSSARFCSASDEENSIHVIMDVIGDKSCDKGSSGSNRFSAMNSQLPPQYPRQSGGGGGGGGGGFSLLRQNSSPAELLSHLTAQNGYNTGVRGIGSYRMADIGGANGDLTSPSSSTRLRNHTNLSSSSLGLLSRITEVENENGGPHIPNYAKVAGHDNLFSTASGFPFGSWNDSSYFGETFTTSGIKTEVDSDPKPIFLTENEELIRNRPSSYTLSHHLSLPKSTTSSEMSNIEKLLHLQDSVPCKVRAKRGCATHPRSIAERVRRTRISERMRKLQELVPNMDKQTNTADMLDLAVEYIKSLQKQYKILGDNRANCKCSASQKVHLNRTH